jgi:hypothetical protein
MPKQEEFTKSFLIRVSPDWFANLQRAADDLEESAAALVREYVEKGLRKDGYWPEDGDELPTARRKS